MSEIATKSAPTLGGAAAYFIILYFVVQGTIPEQYHTEAVAMAGVAFTHIFWELGAFRTWLVRMVEKKVNKEE